MIINDIPFLCNPIGYPRENIHVDFYTLYPFNCRRRFLGYKVTVTFIPVKN